MVATELTKRYNIIYIKWSPELKFNYFWDEVTDELDTLWYEGVYLGYYSSQSYHYCVDSKLRNTSVQLGYDKFIKPMPEISWILLIINWSIISLLCISVPKVVKTSLILKSFIFEFVNMFNLVCCIGIQFRQNMRSLIIISFGCFLFWSIDQNNIIGLTMIGKSLSRLKQKTNS